MTSSEIKPCRNPMMKVKNIELTPTNISINQLISAYPKINRDRIIETKEEIPPNKTFPMIKLV